MEGAAGNDEVYLQASDTLNTGYESKNIRKCHTILNQNINNKEKTVSSKLVGVKWCDIHKE